jgi:hypothetical protein
MDSMKKTIAAFTAFCALLVSLFAAPAAAQANETPAFYPSDCSNSAYICFYENSNPAQGWDQRTVPSAWSKSVCYSTSASTVIGLTRYISNPTASNFVVYLNSTCSGTSAPIYAHSSGAMNGTWAAKIRSIVRFS